jgi:hypothetical protein
MFAHKTSNLLVIDGQALLPKGGLDSSPAIMLELVANPGHRCDDGGVGSML